MVARSSVDKAILYNRKKAYSKETIWKIQTVLGVEADGIIGFGTVERLREWQASYGLQADGRIGPDTLRAMNILQSRAAEG